jgi:trk system potassium uptake protein TrkH
MLAPLGWAVHDDWHSLEVKSFVITILIGIIISTFIQVKYKTRKVDFEKVTAKDGLAIVGLLWIILSLWGALPLWISKVVPTFTDAFFEIASGFTTTGASIFSDVESIPRGILFWRSLTHWLGGMGIIVLFIAILPSLGATSSQLYKIETSGLDLDRSETQIRKIARNLWLIYLFLTCLSVVLLMIGKMPLFDALCHTFGAIATGGFSTKNTSIGGYSAYIQWVIILMMFLGGINFSLYCYLTKKKWKLFFKDSELKTYTGIILFSIPLFFILLKNSGLSLSPLRDSVFQIVSILTATGYSSTDFDLWPSGLRMMLIIFMFIGGCASSTSGGMKVVRVIISVKAGFRAVVQTLYSHAVIPVRYNGQALSENLVRTVMTFVILYLFLFVFGSFFLLVSEPSCDIVTATTASIACLSTVGPGLAKVGPFQNFAWISIPGKWMLSFLMIAGRLELYAMLALFIPATWKK